VEVARSLQAREGFGPRRGLLLWLAYNEQVRWGLRMGLARGERAPLQLCECLPSAESVEA